MTCTFHGVLLCYYLLCCFFVLFLDSPPAVAVPYQLRYENLNSYHLKANLQLFFFSFVMDIAASEQKLTDFRDGLLGYFTEIVLVDLKKCFSYTVM